MNKEVSITKALRHQLEFIEQNYILLMLLVYFFSILKQLSLYVSDLNIKGSSKKDFSLIKSSSEHIKLCCKIKKLLFSSIIQQFEL